MIDKKFRGKSVFGITGLFGSGKSEVRELLGNRGAYVLDADQIAHKALDKGSEVFPLLLKAFPEALKSDQQEFDRKKLAAIVFESQERRKQIEELIHPFVRKRILELVEQATKELIFVEVPLLFEAGFESLFDEVILVKADLEVIQDRLGQKGFLKEEIQSRMKAQWPLEEKEKKASYILDNSGSKEDLNLELDKLWQHCLSLSKGDG